MKKTVIWCSALAALCIVIFSCQTVGREVATREPVVTLSAADITGIGLEGVNLLCTLNVENPNSVTLSFPEIEWELFVNSNSFLSGIIRNEKPLRSNSTTVVDVPVHLSYAELFATMRSLRGRKDADYHIALETRFLLPLLGERIWNFEHQGKIPLVQMIAFRNPSFAIEGMDFNGVNIRGTLDVDNPNPFRIPFPLMEYNYAIRGSSFITSTLESPASLAAQALTPVNIRLRVEYSDLYRNYPSFRTIGEAATLLSLSSLISLPGYEPEKLSLEIPGSLPLLKAPVLSFRGITVKNIGLSRIDLEFGWDLDNPNGFDLRIRDMDYTLMVNNTPWAQGTVPGGLTAAASRKTTLPVTVAITSPAMVKDLTDIITRGMDVSYDLKGTVGFSLDLDGFSDPGAPYSFTGRTRLRR
jgi:LEA14-like dessication related protein